MEEAVRALAWPREALSSGKGALGSRAKRALDVVVAAALLVLLSPLLALLALAVRLTSPGPALFAQERIGLYCRRFRIYKFRTMVDGAERREAELARAAGRVFLKLRDDPRQTRLGRWLRRASLDELPQLWNVVRGEMSLVGPRPLLVSDLRAFPLEEQARRFAVRPGITGLWQVSGRSDRSDEERMALDLEYVDRWSLALDLRLLARTLPAVLSARGAT